MSRVLVTGGTSPLGAAIVRRLLRDPAYDVRVADERPAPQWMREGSEIHAGDLRDPAQARRAVEGCPLVVQLPRAGGPFTALETTVALVRAALDAGVERFVHVSDAAASGGEAAVRAAGVEQGLQFALGRVGGDPKPQASRLDDAADAIVATLASRENSVELGEM